MTPSRRRTLFLAAAPLAVVAAVALALFQPWKLWVDERVEEAAPVGATEIVPVATTERSITAAPPASTAAPAPTTAPAATSASPVSAATVPATTTATTMTVPPSTAAPSTTAPPPASFVSLAHPTSGQVVLLADADGRRFVRFVELMTDNGPDLKVYLSTNTADGPEGAFDDDVVDLGRLRGNLGSQNYEIPAGVDLARFRSVVIWCDRFNSAFGAAPLT